MYNSSMKTYICRITICFQKQSSKTLLIVDFFPPVCQSSVFLSIILMSHMANFIPLLETYMSMQRLSVIIAFYIVSHLISQHFVFQF